MENRLFTGREKERRFFASMLEGREPTRVLVVTGMGGIGKTELLKQFQHLADERHVPWVRIDGSTAEDVPRILDEIARQLVAKDIKLEPLGRSLREYARIRAKLPAPARAAFTMTAEAIGGATHAIPGIPPELAAGAQAASGDLAASIYDVLKPADVELYLDAPRRLTDRFVRSLSNTRRGIVLFFDTYEKMLGLDPWLRDLALRVTDCSVWLVTAGQAKLDTRWSEVSDVRELAMSSLTIREARFFLKCRGLTDPTLIESIARFSYGIPLALHLAADLALDHAIHDFDQAPQKQQIVNQLLQRTAAAAGPEETRMLLACAIPRSLKVPLVQHLLPDSNASAIMADLHDRPYVVYQPKGLALHDSIREFAYAKLRYENQLLFEQLQKAAVAYYDAQLAAPAEEHRELAEMWLEQAQERLYHTLELDEEQGCQYFNALYWQVDSRFLFADCLNLANVFLRHPFTKDQFSRLGRVYKAHALYDLDRWEEAKALQQQVLEANPDPDTRSLVLGELGRTCTMLNQWDQARRYLEEAITLKRQLGDEYGLGLSLTRLANVHSHMHTRHGMLEIQLFKEALAIFERVRGNSSRIFGINHTPVEMFERVGPRYRQVEVNHRLAFSYRILGRWKEAEQHAMAALSLCDAMELGKYRATYQRACTLDTLAHLYRDRGLFGEARECAREALALFRSLEHDYRIVDALQGLAHIEILLGHVDEARACLDEAMTSAAQRKDSSSVAILQKTLGQLYLSENRLDEAAMVFQTHLRAMIDTHQELRVALAHHRLGEVFQRLADWDKAKYHLRAAICFFCDQGASNFRAVESFRLFGLVLFGEGHCAGGVRLLRFALEEAENRGLLHAQANTPLALAKTLLNELTPDRLLIERHLDTAAKLGEELGYQEVLEQVAQLRGSMPASRQSPPESSEQHV